MFWSIPKTASAKPYDPTAINLMNKRKKPWQPVKKPRQPLLIHRHNPYNDRGGKVAHLSINVPLDEAELTALTTLASVACRSPREHLRYLLRRHAWRRGLLPTESDTQQKTTPTAERLAANAVSVADSTPNHLAGATNESLHRPD